MRKVITLITTIALFASPLSFANNSVSVSGSTSVSNVVEVLAETYQKNTNNRVDVQGMGSSAGIIAATNGTSMLGMSSRVLRANELTPFLEQTVIAKDGIAIVINESNPVSDLTLSEVNKIYRNKITNWKQVGGDDKKIVVVTREASSGTREAFERIVGLKKSVNGIQVTNISPSALVGNGNGMVKTLVSNNQNAISFISLGSVDDSTLKVLKINGVVSSDENIVSGEYQIARPFIFVFNKNVPKEAHDFMQYVLSDEGQQIVEEQGYIRVK
ncbi:MAG: phosphate ABC transporter substrate-binding protein [Psychromonas sp.]